MSRPRRRRPGCRTASLLATYREFYAGEPFVVVSRRAAADEGGDGRATRARSRCATTSAPARVLAIGIIDNLVKGASGGRSRTPTCCSASPRPPASRSWGCGHERRRARVSGVCDRGASYGRVGAARAASRRRRARPRDRRDRGPARGAGRRRVHHATSRPRRRCRSAASTCTNGHAAAVVLSSGNANAATGERGRADARRMAELTGAGLGVARRRRARLLHRAHRLLRCRWRRSSPASPRCAPTSTARPPRPTRSSPPTPCARRPSPRSLGTARSVGGMAKGAAMLSPAMATMLAVVTTDVRIDPTTLAEALLAATDRHVRRPDRRRLDEHERHGARARQRRSPASTTATSTSARSPTRSPRSAARSPSRWHATPRAPRSWSALHVVGAASYEDARRAARAGRRLAARAVLVQRRGPLLGPGPLRARRERREFDPGAGRRSPTAGSPCATTASRRATRRSPTRSAR